MAAAVVLILGAQAALGLEGRVVMKASGTPIEGAEVSLLGLTGMQRTDAEGRFMWFPQPVAPFEVLVVLPGGRYMKPFLITSIPADGPVIIAVEPLVEESVLVTAGAGAIGRVAAGQRGNDRAEGGHRVAPTRQPGSDARERGRRLVHLRGPGRGSRHSRPRTRAQPDSHRRSARDLERRVGPSATYLDPFVLGGVEVSRGPGSVAYGSDAFGGIMAARTRDVAPGAPLHVEAIGDYSVGIPGGRVGVAVTSPLGTEGGILVAGHYRSYGSYDSPDGEVFNSGLPG